MGEDLGKVGGALPAASERADAVGAAEVGEGREAVGDGAVGGYVRQRCSRALWWEVGYLRRLMPEEESLSPGPRRKWVSVAAVEETTLDLLGDGPRSEA